MELKNDCETSESYRLVTAQKPRFWCVISLGPLVAASSASGRTFYRFFLEDPRPLSHPPAFLFSQSLRFLLFLNVETYLFYLLLFLTACWTVSCTNYEIPGVVYRPPSSTGIRHRACLLPVDSLHPPPDPARPPDLCAWHDNLVSQIANVQHRGMT